MAQEATKLVIDNQNIKAEQHQLPALADQDVRIQVLYAAISQNDILLLQGKHKNDYFGTGLVGKVTAVGKNVGHTKLGQIVGVYHDNQNHGDFTTGFATHRQVHQHQVFSVPNSIEPDQAASILATGVTAYNAVLKIESGSSIAVVGTGSLAYLTTQYGKKAKDLHITIFGYEGDENLAKEWGADRFIALSSQSLQKEAEKYQAVIVADIIKEADAANITSLVWRNGYIYYALDMGYNPNVAVLDLICGQKSFLGVKRGDYNQAVKALHAAVWKGVRAKVEVFEANNYLDAFEKAKVNGASSIVLKY